MEEVEVSEDIVIAEAVEESPVSDATAAIKAVIEAAIYITDEPLTADQIATAIEQIFRLNRRLRGLVRRGSLSPEPVRTQIECMRHSRTRGFNSLPPPRVAPQNALGGVARVKSGSE